MEFRKLFVLLVFCSLTISLSSCNSSSSLIAPVAELNYELMYKNAVVDAMLADEIEISDKLIPITENNTELYWKGEAPDKRVLVVSMIPEKYIASYPVGDTITLKYGESWVTAVPEMEKWFEEHKISSENYTLRAQQLLGLPVQEGSYYLVEMWVLPSDMFRPAPDNEISDNTAGLYFPADVDSSYQSWYNDNILSSYFPARGKYKYPWTRLGYTYDWGNPETEIGLSEFVVRKNSKVYIKQLTPVNSAFL